MDRTIVTHPGVEINDSGKSLRILFMYKGTRCRETINLQPTKTNIKYCSNLRAEILNKIAKNAFNYTEYFPDSKLAKRLGIIKEIQKISCTDLLNQQLLIYAKKVSTNRMSPSTFNGYKKIINGHLLPTFGNINIQDITPVIIKRWLASMNVTPKTINNCLIPLRHILEDSLNNGLIAENPMDKIVLKKLIEETTLPSNYIPEPFTDTEKQLIINSADGQIKNLIQFGFWSGLRTSELIALKWVDIDFKAMVANISRAKVCNVEKGTKTKAGIRTLILLPKAFEALTMQLKYTNGDEFIFHNPNTNRAWVNSSKVSDIWRSIVSKLSIKYRNCYQMRHTYASTLLSNGENPLWVSNQMGHADTEMIFKKYGRWIPNNSSKQGYNLIGNY